MGLFWRDEDKELNDIWDNGEGDFMDYDDLDYEDFEREEVIEKLRGTISRGECMYCRKPNAMVYEGEICFVCRSCNNSCHEDIYYQWISGFDIEID